MSVRALWRSAPAARRLAIAVFVPLAAGAAALLIASALGIHGRWQSAMFYSAQLVVGIAVARRLYGLGSVGLGRLPRRRDLAWPALLVALRLVPWLALISVVGWRQDPRVLIPALGYFLFLNAAGEELLFRGLLFRGVLGLGVGTVAAALASSIAFGLIHLTGTGLLFIPVFVADGLAFCALRIREDSLYPPIAAHGLLNFATSALLISTLTVSDGAAIGYVVAVVVVDLGFVVLASRMPSARRLREAAPA